MGKNNHYSIPTRTNTICLFLPQILAFFFIINFNISYSQSNTSSKQKNSVSYEWEAGVFIGGGTIFGDIPSDNFDALSAMQPAFGLSLTRNLTQTLSLRGGIIYSTLKDSRPYQSTTETGSVNFKLKMTDFSGALYFEPLGENRQPRIGHFKQLLSPYFFVGVGAAYGQAETVYENIENTPNINRDDNEKTEYRANLLFGAGVKYDLSRKMVIGFEVGIRPTSDDFLDGISHAGNPNKNDWFGFGGFTLHYRLGEPDADQDGIADSKDQCPGAPGLEKFKGCPDSDGDGIKNSKDDCPDVKGSSVLNGCPDSDKDGIADHLDDCPNMKGMMRMNGCPDKDWDYVIDSEDECPDVPGLVALKGCPKVVVTPEAETMAAVEKAEIKTFPEIEKVEAPAIEKEQIVETVATPIIEKAETSTTIVKEEIVETPAIAEVREVEVIDVQEEPITAIPTENSIDTTEIVEIPVEEEVIFQIQEEVIATTVPEKWVIENTENKILEEDILTEKSGIEKDSLPTFDYIKFEKSSNQFTQETYYILTQVAEILPQYPDHILHISAYAELDNNGNINHGIAGKRVFSCYKYLLQKGVPKEQMVYYNFKKLSKNEEENGKVILKLKE